MNTWVTARPGTHLEPASDDGTPAALDAAGFPADGENMTALLSA